MSGFFFLSTIKDAPHFHMSLKGLGHAILGNFSIDQVVIELTEITK